MISSQTSTQHVYVVDDDESVRKAIKRMITAAGYSVDAFPSAQNFLDSMPLDAKGVLVLDVFMPDLSGYELQEKLNALRSELKIIFITAHAHASDRELAMNRGAYGFLQKPFDENSLLTLIQSAFLDQKGRE